MTDDRLDRLGLRLDLMHTGLTALSTKLNGLIREVTQLSSDLNAIAASRRHQPPEPEAPDPSITEKGR
jgi:hypothetical protein